MPYRIYDETLNTRIKRNYQHLAVEIVIQAAKDYQIAVRKNDFEMMKDCETFFHSQWYEFLTDVDADAIMDYARRKIKRIYTR